jgi:Importin-beta N-terminal domain
MLTSGLEVSLQTGISFIITVDKKKQCTKAARIPRAASWPPADSLRLLLLLKQKASPTAPPPISPSREMAQSLELLLIQFLMPDNDARRQAEEQIKRLARDPNVVPSLVHHLRTAKSPNVRQLSAVLLRKKVTSHWPKLSRPDKASLKSALLDSITLDNR